MDRLRDGASGWIAPSEMDESRLIVRGLVRHLVAQLALAEVICGSPDTFLNVVPVAAPRDAMVAREYGSMAANEDLHLMLLSAVADELALAVSDWLSERHLLAA